MVKEKKESHKRKSSFGRETLKMILKKIGSFGGHLG